VVRREKDQVVVLLAGMLGAKPPTDDGMLAFAASVPGPDIADVLRAPDSPDSLDEPVKTRYPVANPRSPAVGGDLRFPRWSVAAARFTRQPLSRELSRGCCLGRSGPR
jgi:hypothetical protein